MEYLAALSVALIGLIGTIYNANANFKKTQSELQRYNDKIQAELEKQNAVQSTQIEELTREVRLHNNFAERIPVIEQKVKTLEKTVFKGV